MRRYALAFGGRLLGICVRRYELSRQPCGSAAAVGSFSYVGLTLGWSMQAV